MKRLFGLIVVLSALGGTAIPAEASPPAPTITSVSSTFVGCVVTATAQVGDLRGGHYFVHFVVSGGGTALASSDVYASRSDTSVSSGDLTLTTGESGTLVLAYLRTGRPDGHWTTVGFALENVSDSCV